MRLRVLLAAAVMGAGLAAASDSPLKTVCDRICGEWGPPTVSRDAPQRFIRFVFDEASGEIRGEKVSTGWEDGDGDTTLALLIRFDEASGTIRYVASAGNDRTDSTLNVDSDRLRIVGIMPDNPALSAITLFSFPAPDRLTEMQAVSGYKYNLAGEETQYYRQTK